MQYSDKLYPNAYKVSYMAHLYTLLGVLKHIIMVKCVKIAQIAHYIVKKSQKAYICTVHIYLFRVNGVA